ncbi:MarR family transcriptional regulator [Micromonospora sp. DR5-3]|uniref:MarR family winged helix-turn-helix transcriptional regulator n=1 Tax=unclassified Micromonospora TaxID=2617518 RepID=UPI00165239BC|nr:MULTISPECIES: MarR family transcriptional regulator [unclassified Micromonospora]MCW3819571.1 MarR family transcriptional regulator [Micromonospora sp. DR5-3]
MRSDHLRVLEAAVLATYEVTKQTDERVAGILARHGLTPVMAFALWAVDPDGPPPTMRTLAERMHCNASNLTYICDQLVRAGLAERQNAADDKRQRVLVLTDAGRDARSHVVDAVLKESPLAALPKENLRRLTAMLSQSLT